VAAETGIITRRETVDIDLDGKVAIVTGSARGIGLGIARSLVAHGARVVVADIDAEAGQAAATELADSGADVAFVQVDVTRSADAETMVDLCVKRWGTLDILVNNAGGVSSQMVEDMPESEWRRVIDVNLTAPFLCSKAALPVMLQHQYGKIVNISSTGGRRISYNGGANYTASKEGLLALTRHLAYEVARFGINVNAICPGTTETAMEHRVAPPGYHAERTRLIPKGRLATVDDTANAVLFLVSEMADYICGVALDVDGGTLLGWYDIDTYVARRRPEVPQPAT
jgi:NAD(P)-dependent dehydrogenase (short-subunit alcohol dehydrogenase family)